MASGRISLFLQLSSHPQKELCRIFSRSRAEGQLASAKSALHQKSCIHKYRKERQHYLKNYQVTRHGFLHSITNLHASKNLTFPFLLHLLLRAQVQMTGYVRSSESKVSITGNIFFSLTIRMLKLWERITRRFDSLPCSATFNLSNWKSSGVLLYHLLVLVF